MVFGWLKKKKKDETFPLEEVTTELPEDLERFRTRNEPLMPMRENYPSPMDMMGEAKKEVQSGDKIDLILQKLETIDVRLKLLEEKLGV